jgi:DNA-binding transcriptional regulator YdaS (Cro superfamily)
MDFKQFFFSLSKQDRAEFAEQCCTSVGHLNNVSYRYKPASPKLSTAIEALSDGAVTRKDMRPSDWQRIWPELIGKSGK